MRQAFTLFAALALAAVPLVGCSAPDTSVPLPTDPSDQGAHENMTGESGDANFRLLISDEPNAIGDFQELWVTISGVIFVPAAGDAPEIEITLEPQLSVNLAELVGENAIAIWEGYLPAQAYSSVVLGVDAVDSLPTQSQVSFPIELPSDRLPLDLPFTVGENGDGGAMNFVFDITVVRTDDDEYSLRPEPGESGPARAFRALEHARERLWIGGPPPWVDPTSPGRPDWVPDEGDEDYEGPPDWVPRPDWAGKPDWAAGDDEAEDDKSNDDGDAVSHADGAGQPAGGGRQF